MGLKTIVVSILILIVLHYIIQFLRDSFTQPIVKYIETQNPQKCEVEKPQECALEKTQECEEISETDMKDELNDFLSSINI